jgi:large subunit ribosomal protein L35
MELNLRLFRGGGNRMAIKSTLRYTDLVHLESWGIPVPIVVLSRQLGIDGARNSILCNFEATSAENEKTMPKLKTHSGAAKRFSKTGTGKIKRGQTKTRHILTSKLPKTKRKLGKSMIVTDADYDKVARMIPYA